MGLVISLGISEKDKKQLLLGARESIRSILENTASIPIDYKDFPLLKNNAGAFVTLRINKNLRGCVGYIFPRMNLYETVCDAAVQAAFNDSRFFPLSAEELEKVEIEISILNYPVPINDYNEIRIGEHGILLNENENKALLLPQVAVENNFNREKFLCALCEKAGMDIFAWQKKKINLFVFTADVFSEINIK